jgi:hypothetical protein
MPRLFTYSISVYCCLLWWLRYAAAAGAAAAGAAAVLLCLSNYAVDALQLHGGVKPTVQACSFCVHRSDTAVNTSNTMQARRICGAN